MVLKNAKNISNENKNLLLLSYIDYGKARRKWIKQVLTYFIINRDSIRSHKFKTRTFKYWSANRYDSSRYWTFGNLTGLTYYLTLNCFWSDFYNDSFVYETIWDRKYVNRSISFTDFWNYNPISGRC